MPPEHLLITTRPTILIDLVPTRDAHRAINNAHVCEGDRSSVRAEQKREAASPSIMNHELTADFNQDLNGKSLLIDCPQSSLTANS
jgi:hypothetical protein